MESMMDSVHVYSPTEKKGMVALTTAGSISFVSIVGLVVAMMIISACSKRRPGPKQHFVRTHVGVYFLCLLICDFAQSVASLISISWIHKGAVHSGDTCTAQGIIYQFGNVGSALWSLTIAVHTFALLFLRLQVSDMACFMTFVGVWVMTGSIVAIGPTLVQNQQQGSFHGISGPWCWITEEYAMSRLGLEYFWMFFSAFFSFVLYTLVFMRLRGNILLDGWSIRFRFVDRKRAWRACADRGLVDDHVLSVARQMLYYPVAYTIVILPVAICRWTEFTTGKMPLAAVFVTDTIFLLSGFVNVVLFTTTRRVIPKRPAGLPITSKSSRDMTTFNGPKSPNGDIVYATEEPDSPTTEEGGYGYGYASKKPEGLGITIHTRPVITSPPAVWSASTPPASHSYGGQVYSPQLPPAFTPPNTTQSTMFFAPSSPSLHSSVSISFSEVNPIYHLPIHRQTIPTLIMTPPSPTPSQRTMLTVNTVDREREIAEARSALPALTRF